MRLIRTLLLGVLLTGLVGLPGAAIAQDAPTTPEGVDWRLTRYLDPEAEDASAEDEEAGADDGSAAASDDASLTAVPLGIAATLRLEGGQVTGFGGCNTFTGGYTLDGTSLTLADIVTTLAACEDEVQQVEDAYLGALPDVRGWLIAEGVLELVDEAGTTLLTFEVPDISLTRSELTGLVTTLERLATEVSVLRDDFDALADDVSGIDADALRERIRALETTTRRLRRELDVRAEPTPEPTGGFNAAERSLLEGIPGRIASRCEPLRSGRPEGTRAAVTCTPNTEVVSRLDYFLLDGPDGAAAFRAEMDEHDVPEPTAEDETCAAGRRARMVFLAGGWKAEGCYRSQGRAHVSFVDVATDCRQLPVPGGRRLRDPVILMKLTGAGNDIARLRAWAAGESDETALLTRISRLIERPRQPRSPSCVT